MNPISKLLIGSGIGLILLGLAWSWGTRFVHLGRLPGDIAIEKENFKFYFPIVSCLLLSALISALFYLIGYFNKK